MMYPEYNLFEVAHIYEWDNGNPKWSRNNIVPIDKIKKYFYFTDYFVSTARYNEDIIKYCESNRKVRGYDGSVWYDHVVIDLDETDPRRVLLFMEHLDLNYGIQIDVCRIYFSGKKGFHILIPTPIFGLEPGINLHVQIRDLVSKLADNVLPYDASLYDKLQVYRLPNTIHSGTGLYKIPLQFNEIYGSLDDIMESAKEPRPDFEYPEYPIKPQPHLVDLVKMREEEHVNGDLPELGSFEAEVPPFRKLCIINMLKGVSEKDSRGGRDETAIRIAAHFKKEGYGFEVVLGLLYGWNTLNSPPMSNEEIRGKVISAFKRSFDYGCRDRVMVNHCNNNCFLFKETNVRRK